jgi:hypothetical protein
MKKDINMNYSVINFKGTWSLNGSERLCMDIGDIHCNNKVLIVMINPGACKITSKKEEKSDPTIDNVRKLLCYLYGANVHCKLVNLFPTREPNLENFIKSEEFKRYQDVKTYRLYLDSLKPLISSIFQKGNLPKVIYGWGCNKNFEKQRAAFDKMVRNDFEENVSPAWYAPTGERTIQRCYHLGPRAMGWFNEKNDSWKSLIDMIYGDDIKMEILQPTKDYKDFYPLTQLTALEHALFNTRMERSSCLYQNITPEEGRAKLRSIKGYSQTVETKRLNGTNGMDLPSILVPVSEKVMQQIPLENLDGKTSIIKTFLYNRYFRNNPDINLQELVVKILEADGENQEI